MVEQGAKGKRRRGRPAKFTEPRTSLSFRLQRHLYDQVKAASAKTGRSISEELERRIERSFAEEDALGGRRVADLMRLLMVHFHAGGDSAAQAKGITPRRPEKWMGDPDCYRAGALSAIVALLFDAPDWDDVDAKNLYFEAIKTRIAGRLLNQQKGGFVEPASEKQRK